MREILFKAKRLDSGEWVCGYLVKCRKNTYPSGYEIIEVDGINYDELDGYYPSYISERVDESTICQYTGLTDKNGNKIWENDILDCKDRVTVVKWHTPCGTWDSVFVRYKGELCSNGIQVVEWKYRAEVIGNIFDNPELLKDGE